MVPMVPTPSEPLSIRCAWYREPSRILDSGVGIEFPTEGRWAADRGGLPIKEAGNEGGLFEPRVCGSHTFLEFPYISPFSLPVPRPVWRKGNLCPMRGVWHLIFTVTQ